MDFFIKCPTSFYNQPYDYIELNASKMLTLSEEELESIREKLNASKIKCEAVNVLFPIISLKEK